MISSALRKLYNEIGKVKLVVVTKGRPVEEVKKVYNAGHHVFGENYIKEAGEKIKFLPKDIEWHLVGHLQSNKVKKALELFDVIQSVDTIKLLEKINKLAKKRQKIMLQVNISRDPRKHGFLPENVKDAVKIAKNLQYIKLIGLMTITSKENCREDFRAMKELFDKFDLRYLSMGMSDSYKIAIKEGANMVRIGRKIFEN